MTATTNLGLKKIDGSENWRQIFDYHNDSADKTDSAVAAVQDGIAIVANGNTHQAIAKGQFVYVRNHSTLAEGLYKASAAIQTNGGLTTSNLTADGSGGLNDLQEQVTSLNSNISNLITSGNVEASFNANANSWIDTTADLTLSGYTPLGIIQIDFNNNDCYAMKYSIYANTLYIRVHNNSATAHPDAKCTVRVLYLKS